MTRGDRVRHIAALWHGTVRLVVRWPHLKLLSECVIVDTDDGRVWSGSSDDLELLSALDLSLIGRKRAHLVVIDGGRA